MPLIPQFNPDKIPQAPEPKAPEPRGSLTAVALSRGGNELQAVGNYLMAKDEAQEKERAHQRDIVEKARAGYEADSAIEGLNEEYDKRTDYINFGPEIENSHAIIKDTILSKITNPQTREVLEPYLDHKLLIHKRVINSYANKLETQEWRGSWEVEKNQYIKRIARATNNESRDFAVKEFGELADAYAEGGIITPAEAERDKEFIISSGQYQAAKKIVDIDPQAWLKSKNRFEDFGIDPDRIGEDKLSELDNYAIREMKVKEHEREQAIKDMQEKNADLVSDAFQQFKRGKLNVKEVIRLLDDMRRPNIAGDRPITRQVLEHYDHLIDSELKGDENMPTNPKLNIYLNSRIADEENPLTQKELTQYIGKMRPTDINRFSDKLLSIDIAEGRRGASTEKQKTEKLRVAITKNETTFIKDSLKDKDVSADELYRVHDEVENLINSEVDTKGYQGVDQADIHEKVKKIIEPITVNWFKKVWRSIFNDDKADMSFEEQIGLSPAPPKEPALPPGYKRIGNEVFDEKGNKMRWNPRAK